MLLFVKPNKFLLFEQITKQNLVHVILMAGYLTSI